MLSLTCGTCLKYTSL